MRRQIVNAFLFLIAIGNVLSSCNTKMNKVNGDIEFDSLHINRTAHLFADSAKPACNLSVRLAYISHADRQGMADSINALVLSMCFDTTYACLPPQDAASEYAQNYVDNYRKDLEPVYAEDIKDTDGDGNVGAWYSYYKNIECGVERYVNQLLTFRMHYEEYTGGAHGIYATTFLNINLANLSPIHLNNLFKADCANELTELLWKQLALDNNVPGRKELEEIGFGSVGDLVPTDNFCIGQDGITFYYNVYEIAPYVMGPSAITLPYESISHLLKESDLLQNLK